jgi:ketopantoate reductase
MTTVLVVGAGAVGRAFLPPKLYSMGDVVIDFVEQNADVRRLFADRQDYNTAEVNEGRYRFHTVRYRNVLGPDDDYSVEDYDFVFMQIGPSQAVEFAPRLKGAKAVVVLENDITIVAKMRELADNDRIFFGIPDVITSNTAPPGILKHVDPLACVTEQGLLIVEKSGLTLPLQGAAELASREELVQHWHCKFFIHNAPHAQVAYLGNLAGCQYVHEAMAHGEIGNTVKATMDAIAAAMTEQGLVDRAFARVYAEKEHCRFSNPLLFDPISRVARDPFRKLEPHGRLVKALAMLKEYGSDAANCLMAGICAAIEYQHDIGFARFRRLRTPQQILREVCLIDDAQLIEEVAAVDPYDYV